MKKMIRSAGDIEAKTIIDNLPRPMIKNMKARCDYAVPILGIVHKGAENHQPLKDAMSVVNLSDYCVNDMEISCVDEIYSTFICDEESGSVRVFNTITGELQRTIGADLGGVLGLALLKTPVPLLFASSHEQHQIFVYNAMSGELVKTIGEQGAGEGQLKGPCDLCVRPSRDANQAALLYVCDGGNSRVQVFDTESGTSVMTIGTGTQGAGDNQFCRPEGIAIFEGNDVVKDPMLFVADFGNNRVQLFHADTGSFIKSVGQTWTRQMDGPAGVTVAVVDNVSDPLLIVSDFGHHRIQIFNVVTGVFVKCVGNRGSNIGQLFYPYGLRAFIVSKDEIVVYVAEGGNKRVQKFNISLSD